MSIYNIIGLIALIVVAVIGTIIKIILRHNRKKLDGVHGYVHDCYHDKEKLEDGDSDGWKLL